MFTKVSQQLKHLDKNSVIALFKSDYMQSFVSYCFRQSIQHVDLHVTKIMSTISLYFALIHIIP